jgi:hypothetical protein
MGGFLALVFDDSGTVYAVNEVFTREHGGFLDRLLVPILLENRCDRRSHQLQWFVGVDTDRGERKMGGSCSLSDGSRSRRQSLLYQVVPFDSSVYGGPTITSC